MTNKSNINGRAYEYIFINTLKEEINKYRNAIIEENSAYRATENARNLINDRFKSLLIKSTKAIIQTLFDMEPMIIESSEDTLTLKIQSDAAGKRGDVRDIIISRANVDWEIGLSIKHNHFAVKHPRLAINLDFGKRRFNVPCSSSYWYDVFPVFYNLDFIRNKKIKWSELPSKDIEFYVPLLTAFKDEILRSYNKNPSILKTMIQYLLGVSCHDFYKIISKDSKRLSQIQSYNFYGKLNQASKTSKPKIIIPVLKLPKTIISFDFKHGSNNTLELCTGEGRKFSFRLHNAEVMVTPSLKFDIKILKMPKTVLTLDCLWK